MKTESATAESQIDAALHLLGKVQPPPGLARRVHARLETPRPKLRAIHFVSAATVAASIAISTFALSPALREPVLRMRSHFSPNLVSQPAAGLTTHPVGGFGAASAVHVPTMPMPVAPIPVSQGMGRGHTRSDQSRSASHAALHAGAHRSLHPAAPYLAIDASPK